MKHLFLIFFVFVLLTLTTSAQTARFNFNADAMKTSEEMSEDSWNSRIRNGGTDYLLFRYGGLTQSDLTVDVSGQISGVSGCDGYTTPEPFYQVDWYRDNIGERERLRFFVVSRADTTLLIRQPDGKWICNDDYSSTQNPLIDIAQPRTGTYTVWIANNRKATLDADLFVTLENYNPRTGQHETEATPYFVSDNPASGATAQIVFVEMLDTNSTCSVSVDVHVANMSGSEQIRIVAYPVVSNRRVNATGSNTRNALNGQVAAVMEAQQRPMFGITDYNYGKDSNAPFKLTIPDSALPSNVSSYRLEIVLEKQSSGSRWDEMVSYTTPTSQNCRP